jgi:S1-C subfamily serine protease
MKTSTSFFGIFSDYRKIAIVGGLLTGLGWGVLSSQAITTSEQASDLSLKSNHRVILAQGRLDSRTSFVAEVVKKVGPAVVRIDAERLTAGNYSNNLASDPYFQEFFGTETQQEQPSAEEIRQLGKGSGFIFDQTGLIFTNAHVVNGANRIVVTLKDGRRFEGRIQGLDKAGDLAVVKIYPQGQPLPVAPLGNSSKIQVGDWAIAVGNPLGLNNSVTLGIVSSLNRSSDQAGIPDLDLNFIQTDVALNPGNSGGPLVNANGQVIGINTAILSNARGISFAIPINQAIAKRSYLVTGRSVPYPAIGITMATISQQAGVKILKVFANQPGAKAGLRAGDIIVQVDQQRITTSEQLQNLIRKSPIDQVRSFKIQRNGALYLVNVRIGQWNSG